MMGSFQRGNDPNPILDEGAPRSVGGIESAVELCDAIGIPFAPDSPRDQYKHSWGMDSNSAQPIICTWTLVTTDTNNQATAIPFDLMHGKAPLLVGLELKQYANTVNRSKQPHMTFKRPSDTSSRQFSTYVSKDRSGNERLRMEIVPMSNTRIRSMLSSPKSRINTNAIKRIHRMTHATADEMRKLLEDAGQLTTELSEACGRVHEACEVCVSTGRPAHKRKISLTHVNEEFNQSLQADFVIVYIRGKKHEVLNMVDAGTNYGERAIARKRTAEVMREIFESHWIYKHGSPASFSADPEFTRPVLTKYLEAHGIVVEVKPSRSSHKNGKVERNNGLFKAILGRLSKEATSASAQLLVSRASFMANLFHGSAVLSAFQLARGYSPSILGMAAKAVTPELLEAHKQTVASRAIQKVLRSRRNTLIPPGMLEPGNEIWVYFDTSAANDPARWLKAKVVEVTDNVVKCRRNNKGIPMNVAFEHIRIPPSGELARELQTGILEDMLSGPCEEENYQQTSLLTTKTTEQPERDVGMPQLPTSDNVGKSIDSSEQEVLEQLYQATGGDQVTRSNLENAPPWLVQKALGEEIDIAWKGAYEEVPESEVPMGANVITSHVVYKVKNEEGGRKRLKARLCPHGNRDKEKGNIRVDSSNARFDLIRLMLSIACILGLEIGCIDVKSAYLQSGPISRELYIRPPREWDTKRGVVWKLIKLPYGIGEAGRQWAKAIEGWLVNDAQCLRVHGVSQLYIKRGQEGSIMLMIAKLTDDLLMAGTKVAMRQFADLISKRFTISKVILQGEIKFNGCSILRDESGDIRMSMNEYVAGIEPVQLSKNRLADVHSKATKHEADVFRTMAGELVWLGSGVYPYAAYLGSTMQRQLPLLKVHDIEDANRALRKMKKMNMEIRFAKPWYATESMEVATFSDASFNINERQTYGQTGYIVGIRFRGEEDARCYHLIDWSSNKQRRVCHSSYGAEILAAASADDRGYDTKIAMRSILQNNSITNTLLIDSNALFQTMTTLHEGREYRLRQTVQQLRDSFESQELNRIRWIQGKANLADALTKQNPETLKILHHVMATGRLELPNHASHELDSSLWT